MPLDGRLAGLATLGALAAVPAARRSVVRLIDPMGNGGADQFRQLTHLTGTSRRGKQLGRDVEMIHRARRTGRPCYPQSAQ